MVSGAGDKVFAIKDDYSLWTWGYTVSPQTMDFIDTDAPIKFADGIKYINGGYMIKTDNSLWKLWHSTKGWQFDKIADNVKKVAYKNYNTYFLKYDGTVYKFRDDTDLDDILKNEKIDYVTDNAKDIAGYYILKNDGFVYKNKGNGDFIKIMRLCAFNIEGKSTIKKGEEAVLTANYYDENGNLANSSDITWYCETNGVASMIPWGTNITVKGENAGITKVTAVHNPTGEIAEFDLSVEDSRIEISGRKPIDINEELELNAVLYSGESISENESSFSWEIENEELTEIVSSENNGESVKIKGKKSGIANIKVTEINSGATVEFKLLVAVLPNIKIVSMPQKYEYGITKLDFIVTNEKYPELDYDSLTEEEYKSLTLVNPEINLELSGGLYGANGEKLTADYTKNPTLYVYEDMIPASKVEFSYNLTYGDEADDSDDAFAVISVLGDGFVPKNKAVNLEVDRRIKVNVNGEKVEFDAFPILENGRTLVPVRKIFNALGAKDEDIIWNADENKVTAVVNGKKLELFIDNTLAYIDGEEKILDVPAKILSGGRTYVPVRFISEAFGAKVAWNQNSHTVSISTGEEIATQSEKLENTAPVKNSEETGFTTEEKNSWLGFGESYNVFNGGEIKKGTYQTNNLVIKEELKLPENTKIFVSGNLSIENKIIFGAGSKICITGDVSVKKKGVIDMKSGGTLECDGDFTFNSGISHKNYLTNGVFIVGGDVTLKKNFSASGKNEFKIVNKQDLHIIDVSDGQSFNILEVVDRGFEVLDIKKEFDCVKSVIFGNWDVLSEYSFGNVFELTSADGKKATSKIKARVETGLTKALISESTGSTKSLENLSKLTKNMTLKSINESVTYKYYDEASKKIKDYTLKINYFGMDTLKVVGGYGTVEYFEGGSRYNFVIGLSPEQIQNMLTSFKATVTVNMADSVVGAYKSSYVEPLVNNAKNTVKSMIIDELPSNIKEMLKEGKDIKENLKTIKKVTDMLNKLK